MKPVSPLEFGLPHREPFLFLDAVENLEAGMAGEATRVFPASADFFRGHFPGNPVVPGVILTEAIAQLAGIIAGAAPPHQKFLLSAIRSMKFPAAAHPDEEIRIKVRQVADLGGLLQFEGSASVGERDVAVGSIILNKVP